MDTDRFFAEYEFRDWLQENKITNAASAMSYCVYLNSVNRHFQLSQAIEEIHFGYAKGDFKSLIQTFVERLTDKNEPKRLSKAPKTLSNWVSGLTAYGEFLYTVYCKKTDEAIVDLQPISNLSTVNQAIYTKYALYKNFTFRLITQDRFYPNLYFPISFIKKIFYRKSERAYFDQWIKDILDRTIVHYQNNYGYLSDIEEIVFSQNGLVARRSGKDSVVFTKLANNIDRTALKVLTLRNIALDRQKPMQKIIEENYPKLIELSKITNDLKKVNGPAKMDRKQLTKASDALFSSDYLEEVNIGMLKEELKIIAKHTSLQLMDASYNSSISAN